MISVRDVGWVPPLAGYLEVHTVPTRARSLWSSNSVGTRPHKRNLIPNPDSSLTVRSEAVSENLIPSFFLGAGCTHLRAHGIACVPVPAYGCRSVASESRPVGFSIGCHEVWCPRCSPRPDRVPVRSPNPANKSPPISSYATDSHQVPQYRFLHPASAVWLTPRAST